MVSLPICRDELTISEQAVLANSPARRTGLDNGAESESSFVKKNCS
jgi:hypothetical protein